VHLDAIGRGDGVRAFALHPGKIITGLQSEMALMEQIDRGWVDEHGDVIGEGFKTPSQGAATGQWAATSRLLDDRAAFTWWTATSRASPPQPAGRGPMDDGGVRAHAIDPDESARLWSTPLAATGATPTIR
jgi:hypothetical protein